MFSVLKSFYLSPFEIPDNYNIAMACIELELTMPVHTLSDIADYLSTKLFLVFQISNVYQTSNFKL